MEKKKEKAIDLFVNKGFNCAQAVLSSHCEEYGLQEDLAKKIACGFGAGIGYNGEICGAVSGAVLLIGLKYGKYLESDDESKYKTYKLAKELTDNFKKEYGTINCTELLKYDLGNKDEYAKAKEAGLFKELCPLFVKRAIELAEEILKKN